MKTYIFDTFNRYVKYSNKLDAKAILCKNPWLVFNDVGRKEVYIFKENWTLLISVDGMVSRATWEYVEANNSIIINTSDESYMLKPSFANGLILVLQLDGTNQYSFLIDEAQAADFAPKTLTDIKNYFVDMEEKAIADEEWREQQRKEQQRMLEEKQRREIAEEQRRQEERRVWWNTHRKYFYIAALIIAALVIAKKVYLYVTSPEYIHKRLVENTEEKFKNAVEKLDNGNVDDGIEDLYRIADVPELDCSYIKAKIADTYMEKGLADSAIVWYERTFDAQSTLECNCYSFMKLGDIYNNSELKHYSKKKAMVYYANFVEQLSYIYSIRKETTNYRPIKDKIIGYTDYKSIIESNKVRIAKEVARYFYTGEGKGENVLYEKGQNYSSFEPNVWKAWRYTDLDVSDSHLRTIYIPFIAYNLIQDSINGEDLLNYAIISENKDILYKIAESSQEINLSKRAKMAIDSIQQQERERNWY